MIVSAINKEQAIVTNIKQTLQQLKQGGKDNLPIVLNHTFNNKWDISFYVDPERTQLLFSENSTDDPDSFTAQANRTLYTPPDQLINFAAGISEQYAQPLYYYTATFHGGDPIITGVYRNIDNLVFQSVIVTTKANAKFVTNANTCMIYPRPSEGRPYGGSDDLIFEIMNIDLFMQLLVYNWANLSEEVRWQTAQNTANLIKNALYVDPTRDDNCTVFDKDLQATDIDNIQVLPSDDLLKLSMRVRCCYRASSTTY